MQEREKYEQLILASPLFSLDRERETIIFKRESQKMVRYLYQYLLACNADRYIDYGVEIAETAMRCIQNYQTEAGDFLHYFNSAFKKEFTRASAKRSMDEIRGGVHLPEEDRRDISRIVKYLRSHHVETPSEQEICWIAEALQLSVARVQELIRINEDAVTVSDRTEVDGETVSILELIGAEDPALAEITNMEAYQAVLAKVEGAFLSCQERQRPLLSCLLTVRLCETICEFSVDVSGYSFLNRPQLYTYIKQGKILSQKEIAAQFDRSEASVSRMLGEFLKKIKEGK